MTLTHLPSRENQNKPKDRDYEKEQLEAVEALRQKEKETEEMEIRQKNEGGWEFKWDEESKPGFVVLEVFIAKYLDSSLIDVDINPTYVSIIVKSKLLRLRLPAEVIGAQSKCSRSKLTGSLVVTMKKLNSKENAITIRGNIRAKVANEAVKQSAAVTKHPKKVSLQEQMLLDALALSDANLANVAENTVANSIFNIVKRSLPEDGTLEDEVVTEEKKMNSKITVID